MPRYKAVLHADVVVVLGQDKLVNARVQDLRQAGTWTGSPILSRFCGASPSPPWKNNMVSFNYETLIHSLKDHNIHVIALHGFVSSPGKNSHDQYGNIDWKNMYISFLSSYRSIVPSFYLPIYISNYLSTYPTI